MPRRASTIYTTRTGTFDASPLPTSASDLPPPPPGTYSLWARAPRVASDSCIAEREYSAAWSCAPIFENDPQMRIQVTPASGDSPHRVELSVSNDVSNQLMFGTQPIALPGPQVLVPAEDRQLLGFGPSWTFQAPYDKLVILDSTKLNPRTTTKRAISGALRLEKRRNQELDGAHQNEKRNLGVVQAGDEPWFCYWNQTIVEGLIYVNQDAFPMDSSDGSFSSTTTAAASPGTEPSTATSAMTNSDAIGSVVSAGSGEAASTTIGVTPPASAVSAPVSPETLSAVAAPAKEKRGTNPYGSYPKVVKLLEVGSISKGNGDGFQPYCQQWRVLADQRLGIINRPGTSEPMIIRLEGIDTAEEEEEEEEVDDDGDVDVDAEVEAEVDAAGDENLSSSSSTMTTAATASPFPSSTRKRRRKREFTYSHGRCTCAWIIGRPGMFS